MKSILQLSLWAFNLYFIQLSFAARNRDEGYEDECQGHADILYSSVDPADGTHMAYTPSDYLIDGGFCGAESLNILPYTPQIAVTTEEVGPFMTLDFKSRCQRMVYWIQTVFIANIEYDSTDLQGSSLHAHKYKNRMGKKSLCAQLNDGGWYECNKFASFVTVIHSSGSTKQLGIAEMRLYSEPNVMQYATLSFSTATQNGYGASNLILQAPRSTSTARKPNGSGVHSCAVFT